MSQKSIEEATAIVEKYQLFTEASALRGELINDIATALDDAFEEGQEAEKTGRFLESVLSNIRRQD